MLLLVSLLSWATQLLRPSPTINSIHLHRPYLEILSFNLPFLPAWCSRKYKCSPNVVRFLPCVLSRRGFGSPSAPCTANQQAIGHHFTVTESGAYSSDMTRLTREVSGTMSVVGAHRIDPTVIATNTSQSVGSTISVAKGYRFSTMSPVQHPPERLPPSHPGLGGGAQKSLYICSFFPSGRCFGLVTTSRI